VPPCFSPPRCRIYPQPDWLIDRASLAKQMPPRVRARELWRVEPSSLNRRRTMRLCWRSAIQERAGLDIITDGEQRRESYSNRFATALDGVDIDNPGKTPNRTGGFAIVPRIVGRSGASIRSRCAMRSSCAPIPGARFKMTVPGPFTMAQQCEDQHYRDEEALALDYAAALNDEIKESVRGGRRRSAA